MQITQENPIKKQYKLVKKPKLQTKIEKKLIQLDLKENDLLNELGYSKFGYDKMFQKNSLKHDTVKKIAKFINVPLSFFEDDTEVDNYTTFGQNDYKLKNNDQKLSEEGDSVWRDALVKRLEDENNQLRREKEINEEKERFYIRTIDHLSENLSKH